MIRYLKKLWAMLPDWDEKADFVPKRLERLLEQAADPLEVSVAEQEWHQQGEKMTNTPYREESVIEVPCKTHRNLHPDCVSCWKDAHVRAMLVIYSVTEAMGHLKTSDVLILASKLAAKMEEIENGKERKWGIALAAEANFDLATRDKNPLPTHFYLLPGRYSMTNEMTYIPEVLEKTLGMTRSEGRRLIKQGSIKIDGHKLTAENVSTIRLNMATIVVGKQGKAIMCHYGIENSTGYRATNEEDINAALQQST